MKCLKGSKIYELMEQSDTLTLGILGTLAHFRHSKQGTFQEYKATSSGEW